MIYEALQIIADEVNVYFKQKFPEIGEVVVLDNIALADSDHESASEMANKIVLTLLTIDEESTLRNMPNRMVSGNKTQIRNEKVNLNLYLLFSGNKTFYKDSLSFISNVIAFFQGKNLFTNANTSITTSIGDLESFRFTMELYTPTFEDLNYIWGTLGNKQYPSALYKLSLVTITHEIPLMDDPNIHNIGLEMIDQND